MPPQPPPQSLPSALKGAVEWLTRPAGDDPLLELRELARHLADVVEAGGQPGQRLRLLELFDARVDAVTDTLKPRLFESRLPLPPALRQIAQGIGDLHGLLAATLLQAAREAVGVTAGEASGLDIARLRALRSLAEQQQVAMLVAAGPPPGLWVQAQSAYRHFREAPPSEAHRQAERVFKGMLALAAAQPESHTAPEIAFLIDFLTDLAPAVVISDAPAPAMLDWFWLEESRDLPPVAVARRQPPAHGTNLYFSCAALARKAEHPPALPTADLHLGQLHRAGSLPAERMTEVLASARARWLAPQKRHSPRRGNHYRIEVCAHLEEIWRLLSGADGDAPAPPTTEWMVLNESSSGFAIMHVAGDIDDLVPGIPVAVRGASDQPWLLCLFRWGRSDNPEHIEIGLELVSPAPLPVEVVPHAALAPALVPAILFGALYPDAEAQTLLVSRGRLPGRRFTLIAAEDGRVIIAECESLQLAQQTARIETIEFRRDFSASRKG